METKEERKNRQQKEIVQEMKKAVLFIFTVGVIFLIILWIGLTLIAR